MTNAYVKNLSKESFSLSDGTTLIGSFPTRTIRYLWSLDRLIGAEIDGSAYFYRYDAQGNVIALLSAADQTQRATYAYDAWGVCTITSDTTQGLVGSINPIRYRGYHWDGDMNLYRLGKRLYDPEVGRFLQPDDGAYADPTVPFGLNMYAYCLNDPVNHSDPTGHFVIGALLAVLGLAAAHAVAAASLALPVALAEATLGAVEYAIWDSAGWINASGGNVSIAASWFIPFGISRLTFLGLMHTKEEYRSAMINDKRGPLSYFGRMGFPQRGGDLPVLIGHQSARIRFVNRAFPLDLGEVRPRLHCGHGAIRGLVAKNVGVFGEMRRWLRVVLAVTIPFVAFFATILTVVTCITAIESNYLEFRYHEYEGRAKTVMSGSADRIACDSYDKQKISEGIGPCALFPDALPFGEASMVYFSDPLFSERNHKRGQVFLEWSMGRDGFFSELERMSGVRGNLEKPPLRSENLFDFPSYVAEYNHSGGFEYALLDEDDCVIRYIKFFDVESADNLLFPSAYRPKKLLKDSDISQSVGGSWYYGIY